VYLSRDANSVDTFLRPPYLRRECAKDGDFSHLPTRARRVLRAKGELALAISAVSLRSAWISRTAVRFARPKDLRT